MQQLMSADMPYSPQPMFWAFNFTPKILLSLQTVMTLDAITFALCERTVGRLMVLCDVFRLSLLLCLPPTLSRPR
jgi:hypothetical protein